MVHLSCGKMENGVFFTTEKLQIQKSPTVSAARKLGMRFVYPDLRRTGVNLVRFQVVKERVTAF